MMKKLRFGIEDGKIYEVADSTLLVFIDETGAPSRSDPNAPIFGVGGLIVEGNKYFDEVEIPWHNMKNRYFSGFKTPLHAADIRQPTKKQIKALNQFFLSHDFGRFANTCVDKTVNNSGHNIEHILMTLLWDRIREVANKMRWVDIFIIFEENHHLIPSFKQEFMSKTPKTKSGQSIKVTYYTHLKDPVFAGMEVADFIIHTAGREARLLRDQLFEKTVSESQPDFKNVFDKKWPNSYFNLSRATINESS
ncbi:MAG: DUF3800 domain-containing protein [Ardenticatenaceae bacterium]|nr:DUF3800 domain-containing protein [Ardenticatenaceae bacterium]